MANGDRVALGQEPPLRKPTGEDLTSAKLLEYDLQQSPTFISQKQAIEKLQGEMKDLEKEVVAIKAFREGEERGYQNKQSAIRNWILFGGVIASIVISVSSLIF